MAAAAITAPKSGGQLFLAGRPHFMETVIADGVATRRELAAWMRARGKERRERIWFRDAETAEAVDAILFVGLLPGWYPPNYDYGACGYATCAEFLHHWVAMAASARIWFSPAYEFRAAPPDAGRKRRSRRLLVTTNRELNAIAAAAISGLRNPSAASGMAAVL